MPAECLGHILSGHFNKCLEYYNFSACICGIYMSSLQLHSIIWPKRGFTNFSVVNASKTYPCQIKPPCMKCVVWQKGVLNIHDFMFISVQHRNAAVISAIKTIHCVIVAKLVVRHCLWFSVAQCLLGSANNKTFSFIIKAYSSRRHNVCQNFALFLQL